MSTKLKHQVFDVEANEARLVSPEELQQGLGAGRFKLKDDDEFLLEGATGETYKTSAGKLESALAAGFKLAGSDELKRRYRKEQGILGKAKAVGGAVAGELTLGLTDGIRERVYGREALEAEAEAYSGEQALGTAIGIGASLIGSGVLSGGKAVAKVAGKKALAKRAIENMPASKLFAYTDEVGAAVEKAALKQFGKKKGADIMARALRGVVEGGAEEGARSLVTNMSKAAFAGREEYSHEALVGDVLGDTLRGSLLGGGIAGGLGAVGAAFARGGDSLTAAMSGADEIAEGAEQVGAGAARMGAGIGITADAAADAAEGVAGAARSAGDMLDNLAGKLDDADELLDADEIAKIARDYTPDLTPDGALWRALDIKGKKAVDIQGDPDLKAAMLDELRNILNNTPDHKLSSRNFLEAADSALQQQGEEIGNVIDSAGRGLETKLSLDELFDNVRSRIRRGETTLSKRYGSKMVKYLDDTYGTVAGDILDNAGAGLDYSILSKSELEDLWRFGGKRMGDEARAVIDDIMGSEGAHGVLSLMDEMKYRADEVAEELSDMKRSLSRQLDEAKTKSEKSMLKAAFKKNQAVIDAAAYLEGVKQIRNGYRTATKDRSQLFNKLLSPNEIARLASEGVPHAEILERMGAGRSALKLIDSNGLALELGKGQSWRKISRKLGESGGPQYKEVDDMFYQAITGNIEVTLLEESPELLARYKKATTRYRALKNVHSALDEKVAKFAGHRPLTMSKFFTGVGGATIGGALGPVGAAAGGLLGFAGGRIAQDRGGFWYARGYQYLASKGIGVDEAVQSAVTKLIKGADAARVGLRGAAKAAKGTASIAGATALGAREIGKGANMVGKGAAVLGKGVGKAAKGAGRVAGKQAGKGLKRAAIVARNKKADRLIRTPILRLGHDDTTPEPMRRRVEVREVMKNPERMAEIIKDRLGDIGKLDPELVSNVSEATMRAVSYLDSVAPDSFVDEFGLEKWRLMSDAEMSSFMRSYTAALDPTSVIEDLSNGVMSFEGADALRNVYPGIFQRLSVEIAQAVQSGAYDPTYEDRSQFTLLFGKAMHQTLTPEFLQFAQGMMQSVQQQEQPGRGANGVRLSNIDDLKLTTGRESGSQSLERIDG